MHFIEGNRCSLFVYQSYIALAVLTVSSVFIEQYTNEKDMWHRMVNYLCLKSHTYSDIFLYKLIGVPHSPPKKHRFHRKIKSQNDRQRSKLHTREYRVRLVYMIDIMGFRCRWYFIYNIQIAAATQCNTMGTQFASNRVNMYT